MPAVGQIITPNSTLRIEFKTNLRPNQIFLPTVRALLEGIDVMWDWSIRSSHPKVHAKESFEKAAREVNYHLMLAHCVHQPVCGVKKRSNRWTASFRAADICDDYKDIEMIARASANGGTLSEFDESYYASGPTIWNALPELSPV
jgi:hypothetical protein